jgi:hypothetical protein
MKHFVRLSLYINTLWIEVDFFKNFLLYFSYIKFITIWPESVYVGLSTVVDCGRIFRPKI